MLRKTGFTLIELLVVVAVITVLMAVLLPALGLAKRLSMQTRCGTQLKGVGSAMSMFNADYGRLPVGGRGVNFKPPGNPELAATSNGILTMFSNKYYPAAGTVSTLDPEASTSGLAADGRWTGLPNAINAYLGGGNMTQMLVCPATYSINALTSFWAMDTAGATPVIGNGSKNPVWLGNYESFMGDPDNTYSGVTTFYMQVNSSYTPTAITYDKLVGTVIYNQLLPSTLLMQDAQYIDTTTNTVHGNHPGGSGGTLIPDSYPTGGLGTFTSAYYTTSNIKDINGSNCLYGDFHVDFIKTNILTPVSANSTAVLFLGSPNY